MPPRQKREGGEGSRRPDSSPEPEEARRRTRYIFVDDGQPVYFFLHKSVREPGQKRVLKQKIENHGGKVVQDEEAAEVILVHDMMDETAVDNLRFIYNASDNPYKRRTYFEKMSFVQHCIRHGKYHHRLPAIKGMGGQIGRQRTEFTSEDDDHLCRYLARILPDKESGGRTGQNVYKALLDNATDINELKWAVRHPWKSWLQRYKMNSERFDPIIAQIAREEGTLEKQLWREDRRRSHAYLRRVRTAYDLEEEEEEEDADAAGSRAHDDAEGSVDVDQGEFQYMELDLDGVEIDSVTGKRKRRPSNSTPLSLSRKKPRFEEHSSPVPNARSKGKQRASDQFEQVDSDQPEFGNDNDEYQSIALDDDIEFVGPGPLFQHSPERTLVGNVSRAHQEPFLTQETVVNERSSSRVSAFDPISHSTSANRRHSATTTHSQGAAVQTRSPTPPPPVQPRRFDEPAPVASSLPHAENPVAIPRPKPRPKKVISKPIIHVSPSPPRDEAPYRNTRSRSRSVEPSIQPPAKRRKAPKQKEPILEEPEPEVVEDQQDMPDAEPELPIMETVEEEIHIENFLTNADESNTSIQAGLVSDRAASLETDDAQTRENLRLAALPLTIPQPAPLRASSTVSRIRPHAVLREYEATRQKPRFSLPVPPRTSMLIPQYTPEAQSRHNSRPRQSEPSPATFKLPEPRTPAYNVTRRRAPSVSSDEHVPVRGTRASAIKKEKEDREKQSPYRPPEGTRADMILRSR